MSASDFFFFFFDYVQGDGAQLCLLSQSSSSHLLPHLAENKRWRFCEHFFFPVLFDCVLVSVLLDSRASWPALMIEGDRVPISVVNYYVQLR